MADESTHVDGRGTTALLDVACVASGSGTRATVSVDGDLPARDIATTLGAAVGISIVGDLMLPDGTPLAPDRSLREAGAVQGTTIFVAGIDETGPSRGGALRDQLGPLTTARRLPAPPHAVDRSRTGPLIGAAVVAAAIGFVIGALAFHGSGSSVAPTGPDPVAVAAAQSWLKAAPFAGPARPGVGATLGRSGPIQAGAEPVGWTAAGGRRTTTFIVTRTGSAPFGLSVVTVGGALAFPPTIGGLPVPAGRTLPALGSAVLHPTAPADLAAARAWAAGHFGPTGDLTKLLDLGQSRSPSADGSVQTADGTVVRITETLTSTAPGTTAAAAQAAAATAAAQAKAAVAFATQQLAAARAAAAAAAAHLASDQAAAAPSPPTPASAAAAAALPADSSALQSAQQAGSAATAALQRAQQAAAAPAAPTPAARTVTASYDLLVVDGSVVGSAPSGWEG